MIDSIETQYLNLLLKSQLEWDKQFSTNILAFPTDKRIAHYLNHLAKYSNHQDFKIFMRNKTYHKTKADFLIITLCLLNMCEPMLSVQLNNTKPYNWHLQNIFWKKDEWDHTRDDEFLYGMFNSVKGMYCKYMEDFGFKSMSWLDQRRSDWYDQLEKPKKGKKA